MSGRKHSDNFLELIKELTVYHPKAILECGGVMVHDSITIDVDVLKKLRDHLPQGRARALVKLVLFEEVHSGRLAL